MNPSTMYYLGLYILVFVIRFFKLKKEFPTIKNAPDTKNFNFILVFFVSLEIVYTSAGFIILLLENQKDWIPAIVIFYIVLVVISSNLDSMDERFDEKTKFIFHIIIILVIVVGTVYSLNSFLDPRKKDTNNLDGDKTFIISIPYTDISLVNHIGNPKKFSNKNKLIFIAEIKAKDKDEAIEKGMKSFWDTTYTNPLSVKKDFKKEDFISVDKEHLLLEEKRK
jgi:hypothetical protein